MKNRSNEIRTNEIRIRRQLPVYCVLNGLDFRWGFWRTLVFEQFSANSGYKNYFSRFLVFSCSLQLHHSHFSLCHAGVTKVLWKFVSSLGLAVSIWTLARFFFQLIKNLFRSFCTIFSYVIFGWYHDYLGWKYCLLF